jgi:uncharacterized SAM-dependent methyltransferase
MSYYKPSELSEKFSVTPHTIYNWVSAAKLRKNDLKLYLKGKSYVIAKTQANDLILEELARSGKRHRSADYYKSINPKIEFYDIYDKRQILDIITNLGKNAEIPLQYNYMKDGAKHWERRMERFETEAATNSLKGTIELLQDNLATIDRYTEGKKKVNIIDLGVGNARPVKDLLNHLMHRGVLHRYIGVDISPSMLEIARQNVSEWFGDKIKFEGFVRDITFEQFDDLVVTDMLDDDADDTINIILLLGGTSVNFRSSMDAFKPIYNSMQRNDLFIHTLKPDTNVSRRHLDLGPTPGSFALAPNFKYILDLLNIDDSLYETEGGYDKEKKMRYVRVRLKSAINIKFDLGETSHRNVALEAGQAILLFRAWHRSTQEIIAELGQAGFMFLSAGLTADRQYFLSISGIENMMDEDNK